MNAPLLFAAPSPRARRSWLPALALLFAGTLVLSGCSGDSTDRAAEAPAQTPTTPAPAPEPVAEDPAVDTDTPSGDEPAEDEPAPEEPAAAARTQAESCEWDLPAVAGGSSTAPSGQEGDLDTIIIGVWQHTHYNSGAGYEPLADKDIRYVFPSLDRMLYCQHVPGITDYAENAGDISWDGTGIVLPTGSVGYTVTSWDENTMVWKNHLDGSTYLLQRLQ